MQFAFTEEQELLRREARNVLADGGWGPDDLVDLGFLQQAVLFEEAGRANRGEEFSDAVADAREQLVAVALEAVGIAARVLELGVEHAKTREQFGRPIGVYQAVAHPLADTYVETELARSLAYWAAWCIAEGDAQTEIAVAAAKSFAGDVAVAACERSIQVHGGIGFTWEHVLHTFYKRALAIQALGGYAHVHRARIARWLIEDGSKTRV
jgi:alkylation response protein AidB-like acyl-CoA dehydrogenase